MEAAPISLRSYARLLRKNRNFRLLWSAQIVSEIGDWLYSVAIYSLILELTGSARAVASAFVLQVLPQVFASPTAGVLNDRLSRKRLMIFADWARAAITFCMLFAQSENTLWLLYILLLLETLFWAVFEPGRTAVIPNVVTGADDIFAANGLSATTWSFNLAVGAAVGGFLAAAFGRNTVFLINSLSFVVSAMLLRRMDFREPHLEEVEPFCYRDLFDFSPLVEGIRYVQQDARLLATMFVKAGISLMGTNYVLLAIFGERIFPVYLSGLNPQSAGVLGMSVLMGSRGLGALMGPLLAGRWAQKNDLRMRYGMVAAFAIASAGYFGLSWAPTMLIACLCVMISHAGASTAWVFSSAMLQLQTDDKFRGRVFSAEYAFSMLTLSTVSYSAGVLADAGMPVRTLAMITGLLVLAPCLAWAAAQRLWANTS